ncbi:MAG: rod shape-determining protein MreD, partial [Synechococcus sp.]
RASPVQRSFNLGLLALLGTAMLGLTLLLQLLIAGGGVLEPSLWSWGLHTLACQTLVTGVLAPMLVSLQMLFWRRRVPI